MLYSTWSALLCCPNEVQGFLSHVLQLVKGSAPSTSLLTLIVPIWLLLQGDRWIWIYCLEPREDSLRPAWGSSCPTQFAMKLGSAMFSHHKEIIIVPIHQAPSWLVYLAKFFPPQSRSVDRDTPGNQSIFLYWYILP